MGGSQNGRVPIYSLKPPLPPNYPAPTNRGKKPPAHPQSAKPGAAEEHPRERLVQFGATQLTDGELLAVLLGGQGAGVSALALGHQLLSCFGGMRGVLNATPRELESLRGLGPGRSAVLAAARECCCRYMGEKMRPGKAISSPADTTDFLLAKLRDRPHEVFSGIFLDNRHRVLAYEELFRGTIDNTAVYPREVVRKALRLNAAALILAHNHPSGVPEPSHADRLITRRLRDALELVDVRLLDHFVVGDGTCVSLASRGLL